MLRLDRATGVSNARDMLSITSILFYLIWLRVIACPDFGHSSSLPRP